jgi:hypothetical protein
MAMLSSPPLQQDDQQHSFRKQEKNYKNGGTYRGASLSTFHEMAHG